MKALSTLVSLVLIAGTAQAQAPRPPQAPSISDQNLAKLLGKVYSSEKTDGDLRHHLSVREIVPAPAQGPAVTVEQGNGYNGFGSGGMRMRTRSVIRGGGIRMLRSGDCASGSCGS